MTTTARPKAARKRNLYTEAEMTEMLRLRHAAKSGNGAEYAFLTQVRDEAGFDSTRTIDALALSLWKSRGFDLNAFEIKCSRADFLSEIRNPEKAERFGSRVDFFWMVVADQSIVKDGELPPGWGLLVASAPKTDSDGARTLGTLRTAQVATRIPHDPEQRLVSRSWLVCMLRAAGAAREGAVVPEEIARARTIAREESDRYHADQQGALRQRVETLRAQVEAEKALRVVFERASGVSLKKPDLAPDPEFVQARKIGTLVRDIVNGDRSQESASNQIRMAEDMLRRAADTLARSRASLTSATPTSGETEA